MRYTITFYSHDTNSLLLYEVLWDRCKAFHVLPCSVLNSGYRSEWKITRDRAKVLYQHRLQDYQDRPAM